VEGEVEEGLKRKRKRKEKDSAGGASFS